MCPLDLRIPGVQLSTETDIAFRVVHSYKRGGKVLICGNGGLAAESEHFAAELMGKFAFDVYIPCIALTSNSSLVTAIANDMGFEYVFSHQVEVLGKPEDILIGMTTSQSGNIVKAIKLGNSIGMTCIELCSHRSEYIPDCIRVEVDGSDTAGVQNEIIKFLHKLAYEVKGSLID
jgi:phosphoheptose isomerase